MDVVTLGAALSIMKKMPDTAASSAAAAEDAADRAEAAAEQAEGAIEVDDTLSVEGRAADAKVTGDKIRQIQTAFDKYNVLADIIERKTNVTWLSNTGLSTTSGEFDIIKCQIVPGVRYYFVKPYSNAYPNGIRLADANNAYLNYVGYNKLVAIPDTAEYVYVKCQIGDMPIAIAESNYVGYISGYKRELVDTYVKDAVDALNKADTLTDVVNSVLEPSVNLADPAKFVTGKYMTNTGAVGNSSEYFYTGKISVAEGDVVYIAPSARYYTAFNDDDVVVTEITFPWTVPSGINGLIVTVSMSVVDNLIITKNRLLPYMPYSPQIDNSCLNIENQNAINGNNGLAIEAQTLEAFTTLEISAYPKGIATHDRLTGYCEFSELGELEFGYGYTSNYFVKIDATNIYRYYNGSVVGDPIPHGLTITDYVMFSMIMGDDRTANVTINTSGGNISFTFSLSYRKNGLPFMRSTTALANVKLSALSADIRKSIWWFGDSYSSNTPERVIGQLNQLGVIGNMLINAVPGMRSYYDANTGGYVDFVKLTNMAKPKYVIWSYGMNDTEANYKGYLLRVKNICDVYNIELYAVKVPSVPGIDNSGKSAYIDELDIKSIDWAKAVGATSAGVWREGYLSSDNVHPTVKGAQAMALRTLVDCPAIMQFN